MIFSEQQGDLLASDILENYVLCHCISSDFALGAGIAKIFAQMGVKKQLCEKYKREWSEKGYCLLTETNGIVVGNLVTKERYFHKPTLETLRQALESFREQIIEMNLNKIAMPKIGCGLDKLDWKDVKNVIGEVFGSTDFEILVKIL
ncbi:MAG: macro domain-containing protein [Ruminococcaceae bacterium]|nr:macro domain-containing protein [Oscillospiraceae bacterium]